ncbi:hypothetical protein [Floccifex sp.]|uniref:hypothetical protein n=1 Tax=Floccifex sp. TaxID=2815810 RepID=UPI003F05F6F2
MLELSIYLGSAAILGLLLICIPARTYNKILKPFQMSTFGIRYIRRRRDHTDTLTNFFLFFSILFCLIYWIIPFYQIIYGIWLFFAFLCTFAQSAKIASKMKTIPGKIVMYGIYLMFIFGLFSSIGLFNNFISNSFVSSFTKDVFSLKIVNAYYYFTNPTFTIVVFQAFILMVPLYCLWAQFKYMRLEETYKARWIFTYIFKICFVCSLMFVLSYFGYEGIMIVFQLKEI